MSACAAGLREIRLIIEADRGRRAEIILTPAGQLVSRVVGLAPWLTSEVLHLVQQLTLPAPAGQPARGNGDGIPGHALNPALARKAFDRLAAVGRAAAGRFNQRPQPLPDSWSRPASGQELMTCSAARTRSSSSRSAWRRAAEQVSLPRRQAKRHQPPGRRISRTYGVAGISGVQIGPGATLLARMPLSASN